MTAPLSQYKLVHSLAVLLTVAFLAKEVLSSATSRYAPEEFRAIYLSSWSAGMESRIARTIELERRGLINAVVIDVKDDTGNVAFDTQAPGVAEYGAKRVVIRDVGSLVERLHTEGIYVIARVVVFTDPKLAEARPDLGVHSRTRLKAAGDRLDADTLWKDRRDLAWIDPNAVEAWDYNIAIARDALSRGFNEVNFDYIRFPSDGNLRDMVFPKWQRKGSRRKVMARFFAYLREQMAESVISADVFGLSTINRDDLGIGQIIEDVFPHFDYVCPMVYPSHFAKGFDGKANPAQHPYEVVFRSMKAAGKRLAIASPRAERRARLRPWLQDFDLGATYTPEMLEAQVRATREALGEDYAGYILWDPKNQYRGLSGRSEIVVLND
jgi:hypothetical protein